MIAKTLGRMSHRLKNEIEDPKDAPRQSNPLRKRFERVEHLQL